jgi:2-polyprenyl-6-methoxyphenol hydroxylase-like FAD-dependent oxidoreductase
MSTNPDVLVVGAGPVGLTATAELLRHGLSCRLIDASPTPSDKSKALVLWSRSLEMLDDMGVVAPFVATGMRLHRVGFYAHGRQLLHFELKIDSPFDYALMIPQNETERLLAEHVERAGVRIERSTRLLAFAPGTDDVVATLHHADGREETVRPRWLVGCDGAHSTVRHGLGLEFAGSAYPSDWLLADVHVRGPIANDELSIFFHADGVLVFFPIGGERMRIIGDLGPSTSDPKPIDPTLEQVQQMVTERGATDVVVHDPVWLAGFRINERKVARYRQGRVILAGDAAHIHSPAGGQGMNTGMQDTYNLAWKLALVHRGRALDSLLDTYSDERSAVGDLVLRQADLLTRAATLRNPLAQAFRNRVYSMFGSLEFVRTRMGDMLSELAIDYRDSPLSAESRGLTAAAWLIGGGVSPGDRMPDAHLTEARTGTPTTLFAIQRGTKHVLLLLAGQDDASALLPVAEAVDPELVTSHLIVAGDALPAWTGPVWRDQPGALHQRLGAHGPTAYLVRPDGYVAWRRQPADPAALAEHLATYLKSG